MSNIILFVPNKGKKKFLTNYNMLPLKLCYRVRNIKQLTYHKYALNILGTLFYS